MRIVPTALLLACASPAAAQIFWQAPSVAGTPLTQGEAGIGVALPGATPAEERASWAWQMRSGLNVAALQCNFDATLLTRDSYNGILKNHEAELATTYVTLRSYFARMNKNPKAAQNAIDVYGTRTYSGFSTVSSQFGFCQAASRIAKAAQFAARGSFTLFAVERLRELRNALAPGGEQYFRRAPMRVSYPSLDSRCWTRRDQYVASCGIIYG